MNRLERIKGCLLGGAVGDALGAPVEFLSWIDIREQYGEMGIIDFAPAYGLIGAVTDDTQMMLFTAEGLLRAFVRGSSRGIFHVPSVIHHALLRWLLTQDHAPATSVDSTGWLIGNHELWSRRAPGNSCIQALRASKYFGEAAKNNSKGCGAVMRVAPCALFARNLEEGIVMAVNHDGDSDSTGVIAGQLLGVQYGPADIPARWYERLEIRGVIERIGHDIDRVPRDFCGMQGEFDAVISGDYPGD